MSKKHKKKMPEGVIALSSPSTEGGETGLDETFSSRGKKTIGVGIGLLVLGFIVLKFTDPAGGNWASTLSPFLILGAYGVIALGIFLPDPDPPQSPPPVSPEKTV
ncbi:MAG: hypothetical protein WC728_10990 [Elusimicrobiota bacterium]